MLYYQYDPLLVFLSFSLSLSHTHITYTRENISKKDIYLLPPIEKCLFYTLYFQAPISRQSLLLKSEKKEVRVIINSKFLFLCFLLLKHPDQYMEHVAWGRESTWIFFPQDSSNYGHYQTPKDRGATSSKIIILIKAGVRCGKAKQAEQRVHVTATYKITGTFCRFGLPVLFAQAQPTVGQKHAAVIEFTILPSQGTLDCKTPLFFYTLVLLPPPLSPSYSIRPL